MTGMARYRYATAAIGITISIVSLLPLAGSAFLFSLMGVGGLEKEGGRRMLIVHEDCLVLGKVSIG